MRRRVGSGINKCMTQYQSGIADTLMNNFITIRYPRRSQHSKMQDLSYKDHAALAAEAEQLAMNFEKMSIRIGLLDAGDYQFFEFQESDPFHIYLHLFFHDPAAIPLVSGLTEGVVGPGDPQYFDPEAFVAERLHHIEESGLRARKYPWWYDPSS